MKLDSRTGDNELEALLEQGRVIQQIPDVVRARALARARATLAATPMATPASPTQSPGAWLRIAVAASIAVTAGVAGAAVGLHWRAGHRADGELPASPRAAVVAPETLPDVAASPDGISQQILTLTKEHRNAESTAAQESYAAEIELLQRAQAAYANGNFSQALALVAKHNRRFPNGRLAEEREGLHVRSLVGSGRKAEARRVVTAFTRRFPRSVLLPHLQAMMNAGQ
jgi:hypothetical protein